MPGGQALARAAVVIVVSLASIALGLAFGGHPLGLPELAHALLASADDLPHALVWDLRLPRVAAAFVVGGMLGLAGALLQALLRNPLADPYVLGVSGGAAVGILLPAVLGIGLTHSSIGGMAGAVLSVVLVLTAARRAAHLSTSALLLAGIVLASLWSALIGLMLTLAPDAGLRGMLFWLMGDLGDVAGLKVGASVLGAALLLALSLGRSLDLLARGRETAAAFGVAVAPVELGTFLLASLCSAAAVNMAGSIGFVGLLAPHFARMIMGGRHHRLLLPAATVLGGSLLVLADMLSRSLIAPRELPVGTMTALLGTPLFLWLLGRRRVTA